MQRINFRCVCMLHVQYNWQNKDSSSFIVFSSSLQTLVPVAWRGWHPQQAQQEPLWLPWRLQVLRRYQHGPGLLQAGRADTLLLVCILFFQHRIKHVLRPVSAAARGVDYYQGNTQSGWYAFAKDLYEFPDIPLSCLWSHSFFFFFFFLRGTQAILRIVKMLFVFQICLQAASFPIQGPLVVRMLL